MSGQRPQCANTCSANERLLSFQKCHEHRQASAVATIAECEGGFQPDFDILVPQQWQQFSGIVILGQPSQTCRGHPPACNVVAAQRCSKCRQILKSNGGQQGFARRVQQGAVRGQYLHHRQQRLRHRKLIPRDVLEGVENIPLQ